MRSPQTFKYKDVIMKNFLSLNDISNEELLTLLDDAVKFKKFRGQNDQPLKGKTIGLIFLKSSTRTRISFEVAVNELGGYPMFLDQNALQLGRGESLEDTAKVLQRYIHAIVIRGHEHDVISQFAEAAQLPVINALTDMYHPCQLLADLMTIQEYSGKLEGIKVAFLGDCLCNMANSWALAAAKTGIDLRFAGPAKFLPTEDYLNNLAPNANICLTENPLEAVKDADYIYTDVWVSMGFEDEAEERMKIFTPFQVNDTVVQAASDNVKVLHCLPAYRGKEITAEVLDGPKAIVWDQAENRLHVQKAAMALKFK